MTGSALVTRRLGVPASLVVLGAVLCVMLLPTAVNSGTRGITFDIDLGWWCVDGRASDDVSVTVVWQDDESIVKQRGTVRSTGKGYWTICGDSDEDVEPGDTISARVGARTRSVTVPQITLVPDRSPDQHATGRAPADSALRWSHCHRRVAEAVRYWKWRCMPANVAMTTDVDGRFDFTTPNRQIGGDLLIASYPTSDGDRFVRAQRVPFVRVAIGKERFEGAYLPSRKLAVELWASGELKAEWAGRADDWSGGGLGWFFGRFADDDGVARRVHVNDRVIALKLGPNADFLVPGISVSAKRSSDLIWGSCGRSAFLIGVEAYSPDRRRSYRNGYTAGSSGDFSVDLTGDMDLRAGDIVWLYCVLESGDEVSRRVVVQ
jgi:hypothetical protein